MSALHTETVTGHDQPLHFYIRAILEALSQLAHLPPTHLARMRVAARKITPECPSPLLIITYDLVPGHPSRMFSATLSQAIAYGVVGKLRSTVKHFWPEHTNRAIDLLSNEGLEVLDNPLPGLLISVSLGLLHHPDLTILIGEGPVKMVAARESVMEERLFWKKGLRQQRHWKGTPTDLLPDNYKGGNAASEIERVLTGVCHSFSADITSLSNY